MATALGRDYAAMSGMIFGKAPSLNEILERRSSAQRSRRPLRVIAGRVCSG
jgi:hypothetical protein